MPGNFNHPDFRSGFSTTGAGNVPDPATGVPFDPIQAYAERMRMDAFGNTVAPGSGIQPGWAPSSQLVTAYSVPMATFGPGTLFYEPGAVPQNIVSPETQFQVEQSQRWNVEVRNGLPPGDVTPAPWVQPIGAPLLPVPVVPSPFTPTFPGTAYIFDSSQNRGFLYAPNALPQMPEPYPGWTTRGHNMGASGVPMIPQPVSPTPSRARSVGTPVHGADSNRPGDHDHPSFLATGTPPQPRRNPEPSSQGDSTQSLIAEMYNLLAPVPHSARPARPITPRTRASNPRVIRTESRRTVAGKTVISIQSTACEGLDHIPPVAAEPGISHPEDGLPSSSGERQ